MNSIENIYFIGGSPCSGKSTIAEILSEKLDFTYFKVDDHLDRYMEAAASHGSAVCKKSREMHPDEVWMRDPSLQCVEELQIYEDIFPYVLADLEQLPGDKPIVTEGAAYLPKLMKQTGILPNRFLSLTPTPKFQISHYSKREWVPYVLEGCRDKEQAFSNWMERDILFAEEVRQQCAKVQYVSLVNNGEASVAEMVEFVISHFGLTK